MIHIFPLLVKRTEEGKPVYISAVAQDGKLAIGYDNLEYLTPVMVDIDGDIVTPKEGAHFQGEDGQNFRLSIQGRWVKY